MNLDLAIVDYWASSGRSAWHQASAGAKIVLVLAVVGSAVFSSSVAFLASAYGLVWVLVLASGLPIVPVIGLATYPALFTLVFIASRWDGRWETAAIYLLRALCAGLAAVWLVGTTPYPDLFAPISRLVPRFVGDALFLSYRAFFTLANKMVRLSVALRLRGGWGRGGAMRRLSNLGQGMGTLVLFSFERSQRVYAVMELRGHSGRVCGCRHWSASTRLDWVPVALAALIVTAAVWTRGAP
ncbi:MAG TPA: energy-coupling factor transporter transmembrane component T [Candidatus Eisenbacteria bacterium]|nr:energy-coupling factor transporter transmembrane component T [Candidatus Eisenbacteria bacterium]